MIAYNPYWLEALGISRQAKRLLNRNQISAEQHKIINAAFTTPLYTPKAIERVFLFFFTSICIAGAFQLTEQIIGSVEDEVLYSLMAALGLICLASLELLIRFRKVYQSGVDDALLYGGLILILYAVAGYVDSTGRDLQLGVLCTIALPLLTIAAIRYVDRVCTAAAFACLTAIVILLQKKYAGGDVLLSAGTMLFSSGVYFVGRRMKTRRHLASWLPCIDALVISSLFAFYLAGNSFIARTITNPAMHATIDGVHTLSTTGFYYAFTLICPLCYVVIGLAYRDRILLRVGLLVEVISLVTLRYYAHTMPLEHTFIILGVSLIMISAVAFQLLKSNKKGFTHEKVHLLLPENVPTDALVLLDRFTAQKEAVKEFEAGNRAFGRSGASLGW
jgi:hypothetical protein